METLISFIYVNKSIYPFFMVGIAFIQNYCYFKQTNRTHNKTIVF